MDSDINPAPRQSTPRGGTVEPANRAAVAKERFQTPNDPSAQRYEVRDPFAEVTYRASTLPEIIAKADHLHSNRFTALDAQGKRTTFSKVEGEWQQGPRAATPHAADARDLPAATNDQPRPNPAIPAPTADTSVVPTIDAKADRAVKIAQLESALADRYIIKRAPVSMGEVSIGRTEYRFRGDTSRVAFTASTFRLATDTNSPSVARSMVDVAEARNWSALRVSGNEEFKRMVWLEASVRGVKAIGYEPNPADLEVLQKQREARLTNRIEPARGDAGAGNTTSSEKASTRGGGRKTVLAAIEAVLVAKGIPEKKREAVMAAATEKLAQRVRDGQSVRVKVYDKAAPSQRPAVVQRPELQRSQELPAPVR
jgi:hypothetical protein